MGLKDLLKSCGYPESVIVLDAETYHDQNYSLKRLSTYEYVTSDQFELLGWAIKRNDEPAEFEIGLSEHIRWNQTTIVMHNAPFDALVLAHRHKIHPPFIIDTLDLARHIEPRWSNKLADLCTRHELKAKGDSTQFKGLHRADFTGQQWVDLIAYATNDAEREYDLLKLLLPKLSNPAFELRVMEYTRNLFIRPVLYFNMNRAEKLKEEMQAEVQKVLEQVDVTEKEIRGNKSFELFLREELGSEEPPMKQGKKGPLLAIAKTDPGREELLNHPNKRVRQLIEARIAVKSWPLHQRRVERMEQTAKAASGKLPVQLLYGGAHTGRWSGSGGINLHNLPARGHPLINKIRTLIEAPRGHVLLIIDFSQIEARGLDWIAEQNDMIRAFAKGESIYCNFASQVVGHRIRKPKETDSKAVAKWHGNYRQLGKIGILGCGYGMGVDRLLEYAKNTFGIDMDCPMAEKVIKTYRRTHSMVVLFWNKVEKAFRLATQNVPQAYELSYGLRFFREDNATVIQLPSKRRLYYTGAKIEGTVRRPQLVMINPAAHGDKKIHMWGGYITENIVQAVSRDILAEAVLKIEELGVRVPLIVHDDMSIVLPKNEVETYCSQIEDIARTPPVWAMGLPVDVECKVSKEYCK